MVFALHRAWEPLSHARAVVSTANSSGVLRQMPAATARHRVRRGEMPERRAGLAPEAAFQAWQQAGRLAHRLVGQHVLVVGAWIDVVTRLIGIGSREEMPSASARPRSLGGCACFLPERCHLHSGAHVAPEPEAAGAAGREPGAAPDNLRAQGTDPLGPFLDATRASVGAARVA